METIIILAALIPLTFSLPAVEQRQTTGCGGTYSNAQCCAINVLNLADLNCANRTSWSPIDPHRNECLQ